ncbi:MAG: NTP transferase domain-containing protein [Peptostreptococcaceae bacterium]|nr:NTP transferase domain-containing protein [Peptostreptococcaceae bacterium]
MKTLILNSGTGSRMGELTAKQPKCLSVLREKETILSRQLHILSACGVRDIILTTGQYHQELIEYVKGLDLPVRCSYVNNPLYAQTNYIYSIYLAKGELDGDCLLMHGDLVFDEKLLRRILSSEESVMAVNFEQEINEKDFKVELHGLRIKKIGVELRKQVRMAQPLYKICRDQWNIWIHSIESYCKRGLTKEYAETAFNDVSDHCELRALSMDDQLCMEVDTPEDLSFVRKILGKE